MSSLSTTLAFPFVHFIYSSPSFLDFKRKFFSNEFQRKNRRSRAMTILRTIAPQFQNGVDPQVQRRLWKDAMEVANTKGYENEIDMLENERIHPNSKEKYPSNDRWITLLKSEEPEGNINKYHYANSVQWPLNALPQLNPQV